VKEENQSSMVTKFTEEHTIILKKYLSKFYVKTFIKKKVNELRIKFNNFNLLKGEMCLIYSYFKTKKAKKTFLGRRLLHVINHHTVTNNINLEFVSKSQAIS